MTGAFLRVKRDEKWCSIEVEHLTDDERISLLSDDERLMQWMHIVCHKLVDAEAMLNRGDAE